MDTQLTIDEQLQATLDALEAKLHQNSVALDPDIAELVNEHFWGLAVPTETEESKD